MRLPPRIKVYGDINYRGTCASEAVEQVTFFNRLRRGVKDSYGLIALHPRNEGHRHFRQVAKEKAEGMVKGAADVITASFPIWNDLKKGGFLM